MPECVLTLIIVPFEQFDVAVIIDRQVQVANLAINLSRQHLLCQTLADALGDLHRRSPFGILTNAAVGESDFHHCFVVCFLLLVFLTPRSHNYETEYTAVGVYFGLLSSYYSSAGSGSFRS